MTTAMPPENILFVDDEPNVLSGIRRQLHKQYHVTTAEGPVQALEIIKQAPRPFAIVVADMRMPEMNGVQMLTQVASLTPNSVRMNRTHSKFAGPLAQGVFRSSALVPLASSSSFVLST